MTNIKNGVIICVPAGEQNLPRMVQASGRPAHLDNVTSDNEFLQANPQLSA